MSHFFAKIKSQRLVIASLLLSSFLHASAVSAAPILDQQYVALGTAGGVIVSTTQWITQTFTVGLDGLLSSVDVQIARNSVPPSSGITLSIVSAPGGIPNQSAVLASALIDPGDVSTSFSFVSVDLSADMLNVIFGQQLGIYLSTTALGSGGGINPYAWLSDFPGSYTGGATYINGNLSAPRDMGFRTFVDPDVQVQAVPEPASLTLVGAGLVAVARWSRRKRSGLSASRSLKLKSR